ncbi:hypothetical protein [Nocardia sp. IFM 10818]
MTYRHPPQQPYPYPVQPIPPKKKTPVWVWVVAAFGALFFIGIIGSAVGGGEKATGSATTSRAPATTRTPALALVPATSASAPVQDLTVPAVAGKNGEKTTTNRPSVPAQAVQTTAARDTTTTPAFAPGQARSPLCKAVPDQYLSVINASFNQSTYQLGNPWSIQDGDRWWIGGHIMDGDRRVSSADVWVADGPLLVSLSGGARRNSTLLDGRDLLSLSAGDEEGIAVQNCVTAR